MNQEKYPHLTQTLARGLDAMVSLQQDPRLPKGKVRKPLGWGIVGERIFFVRVASNSQP